MTEGQVIPSLPPKMKVMEISIRVLSYVISWQFLTRIYKFIQILMIISGFSVNSGGPFLFSSLVGLWFDLSDLSRNLL